MAIDINSTANLVDFIIFLVLSLYLIMHQML